MPSSLKIFQWYHYDAVDRLSATGLSPHGSTQRFYQGNHLATELQEHSQRTIIRHESQPLAQHKSTHGLNENTLVATDQAYSLLHSLTQFEAEHFAYTAYGHHPAESGLSSLLGFNGEPPDALTGHYLLGRGKRAFNPVLMRFNSPDNLSPFDEGGINPYAYCKGDSINYYDPTGNVRMRPPAAPKITPTMQTNAHTLKFVTQPRDPLSLRGSTVDRTIKHIKIRTFKKTRSSPSDTSKNHPRPFEYDLSHTATHHLSSNNATPGALLKLSDVELNFKNHIKNNPNFSAYAHEADRKDFLRLTGKLGGFVGPTSKREELIQKLQKPRMKIMQTSIENYQQTSNEIIRSGPVT